MNRADSDRKKNAAGEEDVLPHRVRHERHALLVSQFLIFLQVRGAADDASWHGPFVDSQFEHHEQVNANESHEQPGNNENVKREESGQRRAGNNRATQHQVYSPGADHRNPTCDRGADAQAPVGILVESQHLACKSHAKHHQQKKATEEPGQFSWKLVGAKDEDLHHVNQDNGNHEVRAPSVEGSYKPTEGNNMIESL